MPAAMLLTRGKPRTCIPPFPDYDLRRRLILGAGEVHVDTLLEVDAQVPGGGAGRILEGGGVEVGGVGEAGAELGDVLAPEGGLHEDLDLVGDEHQIAGVEIQVDATGGVGDR